MNVTCLTCLGICICDSWYIAVKYIWKNIFSFRPDISLVLGWITTESRNADSVNRVIQARECLVIREILGCTGSTVVGIYEWCSPRYSGEWRAWCLGHLVISQKHTTKTWKCLEMERTHLNIYIIVLTTYMFSSVLVSEVTKLYVVRVVVIRFDRRF